MRARPRRAEALAVPAALDAKGVRGARLEEEGAVGLAAVFGVRAVAALPHFTHTVAADARFGDGEHFLDLEGQAAGLGRGELLHHVRHVNHGRARLGRGLRGVGGRRARSDGRESVLLRLGTAGSRELSALCGPAAAATASSVRTLASQCNHFFSDDGTFAEEAFMEEVQQFVTEYEALHYKKRK